jgi:hypothetical protein
LTPKPSSAGIIATGIEDHDVQAILGIFHSAQDTSDMDRSDLHILLSVDTRPNGHEIILTTNLQTMTRKIKQPDSSLMQLLTEGLYDASISA